MKKKGIITNRNKFVLGGSGSGKSFFMNHLVRQYWEQGTHVVLVDTGNSYQGLCELIRRKTKGEDGGDDQRRDVARGAGHARHTGGADIGFAGIPATEGRFEAEARRREGKAWLVDDEVYEQRLADMGITDLGEIISMWAERTWYDIKAGFRQLVRDFFELLFNAAGLTIDTLRTFFLVVLSILGPLSFALSIYDGFHSTLASWISRYISVYLWLPIADLFSAVLAKIQTLMLQADVLALQDPNYIPDSGSGGAMGGINKAGAFATGVAGGIAGNMIRYRCGRRWWSSRSFSGLCRVHVADLLPGEKNRRSLRRVSTRSCRPRNRRYPLGQA